MKKLAVVTTHPIQYNAPWFRLLAQRDKVEIKVFYTWSQAQKSVMDHTFGKEITWDIPLLEGYEYEFVENISKKPGSHHFYGIDCPSLVSRIEEFNPDALLIFGWNFKSHLRLMRYFKGKVPVWFRGDSTLLDEVDGLKTALRRFILKRVYRYVDKAFYVGHASKKYFLKHGLTENQLIYAPHAIDNNRFNDSETKSYEAYATKWRAQLGLSENDIVILFAGKFEVKKQPNFLINTVMEANKSRSQHLKLILVGNGPLENELKMHTEISDDIIFIPFQNQTKMPIVYRLGDVFCLPSKGPRETWGLAVNEAMACSRPVIVSDKVGCNFDLVKPGHNGYSFNSNNQEQLVEILKELSLPELNDLGKQAFNDIQKYNFEAIVMAIEGELSQLKNKES